SSRCGAGGRAVAPLVRQAPALFPGDQQAGGVRGGGRSGRVGQAGGVGRRRGVDGRAVRPRTPEGRLIPAGVDISQFIRRGRRVAWRGFRLSSRLVGGEGSGERMRTKRTQKTKGTNSG